MPVSYREMGVASEPPIVVQQAWSLYLSVTADEAKVVMFPRLHS